MRGNEGAVSSRLTSFPEAESNNICHNLNNYRENK